MKFIVSNHLTETHLFPIPLSLRTFKRFTLRWKPGYWHKFKERGLSEILLLCACMQYTHTHVDAHSSMIHVIRRMFFLIPGRQRDGGGPHRSFGGRPSVQTSSFSAPCLHLSLSLTWYILSKCSAVVNPLEHNAIQKKLFFNSWPACLLQAVVLQGFVTLYHLG